MKKRIQKTFGMLLALVLLLTSIGGASAFAAGPGTSGAATKGTITVKGAEKGKEYQAYKIFDLSYNGNNVSYTIVDEWKGFFSSAPGSKYIVDTNSGNLNPIVVDGKEKFINITEQNIADFAKDAMGQMHGKTVAKTATANGDTATFSDLDLGYYMVYPKGAVAAKDGQSSIVSITSTKPNGEVMVKGTYPTIKKTVDKNSADFGEEVTFTLTSKVPNTTGYSEYTFEMTDTLSKGLTFVDGSVKVSFGGEGEQAVAKDSTKNVYYTAEGANLKIAFNMLNLQDKVGQEIKVTYKAKVNDKAVIAGEGNPNKVELTYSNDPKDSKKTEKTPEEKVVVYTGKIKVIKHDKGNKNQKLEGAKFVLKNKDGKFYKLTNGVVSWEDAKENAMVCTSDENGELAFTGIKAGTYSLVETEAPKGYNLKIDPTEVTLTDKGDAIVMEKTAEVANSSGVELPKAGGNGTKVLAAVGAAVILYAGYSLLRGKQRAKERS